MQVGDLATWVGAIGTVGALVFTAYTLRRQIDRERRSDDEHRRIYAKRVRVSITEEPLRVAEVINDGDANIYMVGVYVMDKETRKLFSTSGALVEIMPPGTRRDFPLISAAREVEIPGSYSCCVQFTDDNGYRWSRYMMGLLEQVVPETDIDRARALLVRLSIIDESVTTWKVQVLNNSKNNIYGVSILVKNKPDWVLVGASVTVDVISAGSAQEFIVTPVKQIDQLPEDFVCIAQFTDASGIQWSRYLMGRLEKVGPDPSSNSKVILGKRIRAWRRTLSKSLRKFCSTEAVAALSCCLWRAESGPGHPSDWRQIEPMEDRSQGRLCVYVHPVALPVTGWPAVTDGLDGDLARLQQWPRQEDGPLFAYARRVAALSRCGELPGGLCLGGRRRALPR